MGMLNRLTTSITRSATVGLRLGGRTVHLLHIVGMWVWMLGVRGDLLLQLRTMRTRHVGLILHRLIVRVIGSGR